MRIRMKRLGGFAGVEESLATVDSDRLPGALADRLGEHVAQLITLCAQTPRSEGADQFHYEIEITGPGAPPRTLTVVDEGDPDLPAMKHVAAILDLAGAKQ